MFYSGSLLLNTDEHDIARSFHIFRLNKHHNAVAGQDDPNISTVSVVNPVTQKM